MYIYIYETRTQDRDIPPGNPNGGGIIGWTPGFWPSIGFDEDWPSAAYEEVIESITDWAFSWPISARARSVSVFGNGGFGMGGRGERETHAGSSRRRFGGGCVRYCALCARSSSRA